MLQFIFQWLMAGVGGALEILLNLFMTSLSMDASSYLELFPFLSTGYTVFRGLGTGLAAVLSVSSLLKFFIPAVFGSSAPKDTAGGVLARAALSGALIYGGNYILEWIIEISKVPYDAFLSSGASGTSAAGFSWDFLTRLAEDFTGLDAALIVFEFAVTLLISWNIIKLMLEICERYLLVGILLYTSPPFFAMAASAETVPNFKRWAKMFISSCAMMSVSVFFLKLILSGFTVVNYGLTQSGGRTFLRLLLMLACCKIAQRADSYLGQIGLGTAPTGGLILDDMVAAGRSLGAVFGGGRVRTAASRTSVLGSALTASAYNGGLAGKAASAVMAGRKSFTSGDPTDAVTAKMRKAFMECSASPGPIRAVSGEGPGAAFSAFKGAAESSPVYAERVKNMEKASAEAQQRAMENGRSAEAVSEEFAAAYDPAGFGDSLRRTYSRSGAVPADSARCAANFAAYGPFDPVSGASVSVDGDGNLCAGPRARACGAEIIFSDAAPLSGRIISGPEETVADMLSAGYNPYDALDPEAFPSPGADDAAEFEAIAADTVALGSPVIADRLLHNPYMLISGPDGALTGAAAVRRICPDLFPEDCAVSGVVSFNFENVTDRYGNTLLGGHGWSADVSSASGLRRVCAADTTAYSAMSEELRAGYEKRILPTGRTEYIKTVPVSEEERDGRTRVHSTFRDSGSKSLKAAKVRRRPSGSGRGGAR